MHCGREERSFIHIGNDGAVLCAHMQSTRLTLLGRINVSNGIYSHMGTVLERVGKARELRERNISHNGESYCYQ